MRPHAYYFQKNTPPLPILQNINSKCPNIQQYLPELRLKSLTKHNTHLYYSNPIGSDPWYAKILKSTTIRRYKQVLNSLVKFYSLNFIPK